MKRLLLSLAMVLALAAPSFAAEDIVVGVTPFPHKDIMLAAKPLLAKEGYNLVIKEFTDYVQPNMALANGQLFANFFQHAPYLDNMNKEKKIFGWFRRPLGRERIKIPLFQSIQH